MNMASRNAAPVVHRLPGPADAAARGTGRAPVGAVLAHATGFHGRVWEPLARQLPGVRCHAVDLRGHGDTPVPEGYDFPWPAFGDDVLAAVAATRADEARTATDTSGAPAAPAAGPNASGGIVGIGHSAGGAALVFAEAARPGTFSALWLYEPAAFPPLAPGEVLTNPLVEPTKRRRPTFPGRADARRNYASKPPMDAFHPDVLAAYVDHGFDDEDGAVRLKCRPLNEAQVYTSSLTADVFGAMARVRCPVVLVHGRDGAEFSSTERWRRLAAQFPQAHLEPHEDLGHFGPLTHPGRMAASIRTWLDTLPAPTSPRERP